MSSGFENVGVLSLGPLRVPELMFAFAGEGDACRGEG